VPNEAPDSRCELLLGHRCLGLTNKLTHEGRPNDIRIGYEPSAALIVCSARFGVLAKWLATPMETMPPQDGRCTASLEAVAHSREPIPTGTRIWHLQHDTERCG
jgi:hypothetical protein